MGRWRKSSQSSDIANCVEVAAWRKSSRSSDTDTCVEVACASTTVAVRDSKDSSGPHLQFSAAEWSCFVRHLSR
ncbi:DUF397 domain-containing protein [Longimycelium tulufanense]|nr:DUF397 domain-containing protein [Longimycelium tulufanense]